MINKAILIGENASGKTNLGYAILDIVTHLTDKRARSMYPYTNLYNEDNTAYFEYTFEFNDIAVVYKYEKKQRDIVDREELYMDGKRVLAHEGEYTFLNLKGAENLNIPSLGEMSLVRYVYANTVLDMEDEYSKAFVSFMKFVQGMLWFSSTEGNSYIGLIDESGDLYEKILAMKGALSKLEAFLNEMGIPYKLVEADKGEGKTIYCRMGKKEVQLSKVISSGTRSLIFFYFWYLRYEKITFVYMDEFDAFYHTALARKIVEKMLELDHIQTIMTTHNTDLVTNELLRPDCIFELKDNVIKSFSDRTTKALREAHNLQKMYKAGAFDE